MLAYVFSHRAAEGVDVAAYEESLRRFHSALAAAAPSGFIGSSTFRTGDGFADWYMVESSGALDVLNAAAVSGARTPIHGGVARMAVNGVGKLLSLSGGEYSAGDGYEVRFAKPDGTAYVDLYERLSTWTSVPNVSLWRRMMVLGPPPEFSIVTPSELELPADLRPEVFRRVAI